MRGQILILVPGNVARNAVFLQGPTASGSPGMLLTSRLLGSSPGLAALESLKVEMRIMHFKQDRWVIVREARI